MKRRAFIALLGGAAAWPLAAGAQQPERMRRIGVLMTLAADDPEGQEAFVQGSQHSRRQPGLPLPGTRSGSPTSPVSPRGLRRQ